MLEPSASIRVCGPHDAAALSLLGRATFLEAYAGLLPASDILAHCQRAHSPAVYRAWLARSDTRLWLAEALPGNAPIGYQVLGVPDLPLADLTAHDLEIKRIYLLQRFRGLGLGRRLVQAASDYARERGGRRLLLGVYSGNHAALAFYEHLRFQRVGARTFHVGHRDYADHVLALRLE